MNFGYQACVSIIQAITDRRDVIIYDQLSHACIIDGMSLSLAKRFVFAHNDMNQLEDRLQKAQRIVEKTGGGILVITEGVFGMKGDTGRLDLIAQLKKKYNFRLMIDDAHGFGIMGKTGCGTHEHYNAVNEVDIYFATFAKSMAMIGSFVCAEKKIIKFMKFNLRSQIYAKSLPLALTIGALKRLELIRKHPEYREHLWNITHAIQNGLRERGFELGYTDTPVTPVYMNGGPIEAYNLGVDLRENYGLFVSIVTYPVIEKGKIILRIIPTAAHTMEDVEFTLRVFSEASEKLKGGFYASYQPDLSVLHK